MYVRVHKATLGDGVYTHGTFASVFEVCCAHFLCACNMAECVCLYYMITTRVFVYGINSYVCATGYNRGLRAFIPMAGCSVVSS